MPSFFSRFRPTGRNTSGTSGIESKKEPSPSPRGNSIKSNRSEKKWFSSFKSIRKRTPGSPTRQKTLDSFAGTVDSSSHAGSLPDGDDSTTTLPKPLEVSSTDAPAPKETKGGYTEPIDPQCHQISVQEEPTGGVAMQIGSESAIPQNQPSTEVKVADTALRDMGALVLESIPSTREPQPAQDESDDVQESMERSEKSEELVAVQSSAFDQSAISIDPESLTYPQRLIQDTTPPTTAKGEAPKFPVEDCRVVDWVRHSLLNSINISFGRPFVGLLVLSVSLGIIYLFRDPAITDPFAPYRQINRLGGPIHATGSYPPFEDASLSAQRQANVLLCITGISVLISLATLFELVRLHLLIHSLPNHQTINDSKNAARRQLC